MATITIIIIKMVADVEKGMASSREPAITARSRATKKKVDGENQAKSTSDPPSSGVKPRAAQETLTTAKVKSSWEASSSV